MKILLGLLLSVALANAGLFDFDKTDKNELKKEKHLTNLKKQKIHKEFRQYINDSNAIVKRGEYYKITKSQSEILSIINEIESLDISKTQKEKLLSDINKYISISNTTSKALQKYAPNLKEQHQKLLSNLDQFNKKLFSIGLRKLSANFKELSKTKNRYIKKPSLQLKKKFYKLSSNIEIIITELYLDDDQEEFLLGFLKDYTKHFNNINHAYKVAKYSNVKQMKPLSYKIKSQLELLIPYKNI